MADTDTVRELVATRDKLRPLGLDAYSEIISVEQKIADCVPALLSRIEALEAALREKEDGWRDISTARKDGTEFLGYCGPYGEYCVAWRFQETWAVGGDHDDPTLVHDNLTHWRPLPSPPLAKEKADG